MIARRLGRALCALIVAAGILFGIFLIVPSLMGWERYVIVSGSMTDRGTEGRAARCTIASAPSHAASRSAGSRIVASWSSIPVPSTHKVLFRRIERVRPARRVAVDKPEGSSRPVRERPRMSTEHNCACDISR